MLRSRTKLAMCAAAVGAAALLWTSRSSSPDADAPPDPSTAAAPPTSNPPGSAVEPERKGTKRDRPSSVRVEPPTARPAHEKTASTKRPAEPTDAEFLAALPPLAPTPAKNVARAWRPVARTIALLDYAPAVQALTPPPDSDEARGEAGLVIRVVDDRGDGVPGARVSVSMPVGAKSIRVEATTAEEGLVLRRFTAVGRYDVMFKEAPEGWLARPAGHEREMDQVGAIVVMLAPKDCERVVEARFVIARAARLEVEVPGSNGRPHPPPRTAVVGTQRSDGSLMRENVSGSWDGEVVRWTKLPAGQVHVVVNVEDVGTGSSWCTLTAGEVTRVRIDPLGDAASLYVVVPADPESDGKTVVSVRQLVDAVGPVVFRAKSWAESRKGEATRVSFRHLAAGRYVVSAGRRDGPSFRPALVDLGRGASEIEMASLAPPPPVEQIAVTWELTRFRRWEWPVRPQLIVFAPAAAPGPRFALLVPGDVHAPSISAPVGADEVLALHPVGSWYRGGANHRFLRLDVPTTRPLEPDRP